MFVHLCVCVCVMGGVGIVVGVIGCHSMCDVCVCVSVCTKHIYVDIFLKK